MMRNTSPHKFSRIRGCQKLRSSLVRTLLAVAVLWGSAIQAEETKFPAELIDFAASPPNPLLTGRGEGFWDAKIRERGWIMREGEIYHLWYTGYDGTREGQKKLGYASSTDGITWERRLEPIYDEHWVEDMMVVKHQDTYYMFAEGEGDIPYLLVSKNGLDWSRQGILDVRYTNGKPLTPGPYGTPTAFSRTTAGTCFMSGAMRVSGSPRLRTCRFGGTFRTNRCSCRDRMHTMH